LKLTIEVPGNPVPKGRPRFSRGRVFTPKKTSDYEAIVAIAASNAMKAAGVTKTSELVEVTVTAVIEIPKSYRGKKRTDALFGRTAPLPDIDNLAKSILDGMNRVVWDDDRLVVKLTACKRWGEAGTTIVSVMASRNSG
jgi:Holliday junction resolvase RusA-like endonuclease